MKLRSISQINGSQSLPIIYEKHPIISSSTWYIIISKEEEEKERKFSHTENFHSQPKNPLTHHPPNPSRYEKSEWMKSRLTRNNKSSISPPNTTYKYNLTPSTLLGSFFLFSFFVRRRNYFHPCCLDIMLLLWCCQTPGVSCVTDERNCTPVLTLLVFLFSFPTRIRPFGLGSDISFSLSLSVLLS